MCPTLNCYGINRQANYNGIVRAKSAKAGCFVPVDPQFALDYHGNTFSIDGIRIETEDGVNGGLFGNAVTARNVMIDGCYVGGLIGALDGEMTVGQCFVAAGDQ